MASDLGHPGQNGILLAKPAEIGRSVVALTVIAHGELYSLWDIREPNDHTVDSGMLYNVGRRFTGRVAERAHGDGIRPPYEFRCQKLDLETAPTESLCHFAQAGYKVSGLLNIIGN